MKKYCFIDTCIISDILEKENLKLSFKEFIFSNNYICLIGGKTLSELHKSKQILLKFYNLIKEIPFQIAKTSQMLFKEEVDTFLDSNEIDISFIDLSSKNINYNSFFNLLIKVIDNEFPIGAKKEVLNSIINLKENFKPKNGRKYLKNEIIYFYKTIVLQQLTNYSKIERKILNSNDFKISHFKSLKSQALIVFWKFYKLKERKPRESDIFDISMSSSFPYIQAIMTENNMANDILMIKKQNLGFGNIEKIYTIKEIKASA